MTLSWLDAALVAFVIFHVVLGWRQGFVVGLMSLLGLGLALGAALFLAPPAAARLAPMLPWPPALVGLVLAGLSFVLVHVAVSALGGRVQAWLVRRGEGPVAADRWAGIVPGAAWGLLGALVIAWAAQQFLGQLPANSQLTERLLAAGETPIRAVSRALPADMPGLVLLPGGWEVTGGAGTDAQAPPGELERKMLELVNQARKANGVGPLAWDARAAEVARAHSRDMIARDYFAHDDPDGRSVADRARKAGAGYLLIGENLAFAPNLAIAHQGLMESPGHRANILRPGFKRVGIGIVRLPPGEDYRPKRPGENAPMPLRGVGGYLMVTQVFRAP